MKMTTKTLKIGGMSCVHCQNLIEKNLKSAAGVQDATVSYASETATVTYDPDAITLGEIVSVIERLDYEVMEGARKGGTPPMTASQTGGYIVVIIALYMLLRHAGALTAAFPLAEAGMSYGMLFVVGLITSVHCVAMCGGINLSQCLGKGASGAGGLAPAAAAIPRTTSRLPSRLPSASALVPALLYNGGRVISYTVIGAVVGALGSVLTVSGRFQGVVQLAAGVFMVIMGITMLGMFPALRRFTPRMPKLFARKIDGQKAAGGSPLFIGLLNGLMPCGPLQAMQLYALSTGSPLRGGLSMLLFSLGTLPLMFILGAASSAFMNTPKFGAMVLKIGAVLVTVMGLTMFTNGWGLGGLPSLRAALRMNPAGAVAVDGAPVSGVVNGVQLVNSTLNSQRVSGDYGAAGRSGTVDD